MDRKNEKIRMGGGFDRIGAVRNPKGRSFEFQHLLYPADWIF